ncbi:MAG: DNA primase [Sedimentisphaerales bacterium]|nr:DNA primase [Sedimentisphaerales bacterium]
MPMQFDASLISRIQQANDIVDVISEHLSLTKKGKELVGLCPFHTDHKPSLYVNPAKQIFKCFACGAGGDVLKFVQMKENLSFTQTLERLAQRAGIRLERTKSVSQASGSASTIDANRLAKLNEWAGKLWISNLWDEQKGIQARSYLEQRKISQATAKKWQLGLALESWDDLAQKALSSKVSEQILVDAGLVVRRENGGCYDKFRNRLMFPIHDVTGRVIAFGGRTLANDPAKYMNSPATVLFDKSNSLFGLDKARQAISESETAVIVEGYTDVIMAHQSGVCNVVAALGTSFTTGHARILRRYGKRVVLVFDSDVAGMSAAERALEVCLAEKLDLRLAFVPEGKDPCDFLIAAGADAFRQVLNNAVDVMDYAWKGLSGNLSGDKALAEKSQIIEKFMTTIASALVAGNVDSISRALLTARLSEMIGISQGRIDSELARLVRRKQKGPETQAQQAEPKAEEQLQSSIFVQAQSEIIEVLLREPDLFGRIQGRVSPDLFEGHLKIIARTLFELLGAGQEPTLTMLLGQIEQVESAQELMRLDELAGQKGDFARRLNDAVETIQYCLMQRQRQDISKTLSDDDVESLEKINQMLLQRKDNLRSPGVRK